MPDFLRTVAGFSELEKLVVDGGPVVAILLVLSILTGTIILRKLWQFLRLAISGKGATDRAIQKWIAGNRTDAYQAIAGSRAPAARVVAHTMRGLEQAKDNEAAVREDVERVASEELARIRSWFRAIEAVVQTAPLLGLFGTVIGMIEAFQKLQSAGTEVDPAVLAGGIWVALLTTAVGLAVAIPSAFVLYWFEAVADREQHYMEAAVTSLLTGRITETGNGSGTSSKKGKKVFSVDHAA